MHIPYVPPSPSWLFDWGSTPDIIISAVGFALIVFIAIMIWRSG